MTTTARPPLPPPTAAEIDLALEAPPVRHSPGPAFATASRTWQGIPTIERAANGRLWAAWYSGGTGEGPDNYVILATSGDDGATWSEPVLVIDPPGKVRAYDPCLWIDPIGRLWLFWAQSFNHFDGRCGVWAIHTNNPGGAAPAWSAPRRLAHGIMMNKPTVLSSGEWLMPTAIWPRGASHADCVAERFSNCYASTDHGSTWHYRGSADVPDRSIDEHMYVERRDGSLWCLVRTNYGIGESFSLDRGYTWTHGRPTGITGPGTRFFVRRLRSGNLLLVYHRNTHTRCNLTASLSDDDGRTWHGHLMIDQRDNVSYPDGVETDDGLIYLIHDRARYTDGEIILTCFTEADVAADRIVSPRARTRVTINRYARRTF